MIRLAQLSGSKYLTSYDWFNNRRLYEYCGDMPPVKLERIFYSGSNIDGVA